MSFTKKPKNYIKQYQNSKDITVLMNAIANTVVELYDFTLGFEEDMSYMRKKVSEMTVEERYKNEQNVENLKKQLEDVTQEVIKLKQQINKQ